MLTLQAFDSNGDSVAFLDLYEDSPISLNRRFQNISDVNSAQGSFTQTFRVPASATNREYFGAYFDLNVSGGFSAKRRRKCVLGKNGMTIIEGSLQLLSCYIQSGQHHEYELCVFGETADLVSQLKGVQLADITGFQAYNHTQNSSAVQNALNPTTGLAGGDSFYAIVDRGFGWTTQADFTQANPQNVVVMLRVEKVLETILAHAGYELTGSFFASGGPGYGVFMSITRGGITNEYPDLTEFAARGAIDGAQTVNITTFAGYDTLEFVTTPIVGEAGLDTGEVFDYGSNFDDTTHRYTAPFDGIFSIDLTVKVNSVTSPGAGYYLLYNVTDGAPTGIQSIITLILAPETSTFELTGQLVAGKEYEIRFQGYPSGGDASILPVYTIDGDGEDRTKVHIYQSNELGSGLTFMYERNLPEVSALDVLRGLQSAFNLLFIPGVGTIRVETAQTYLYSGDLLDWSKKVDYDKDFVIRPTSELQQETYTFTHAESQDIIGNAFVESAGRTFGRYKIKDTENDFASGDLEINTGFHPWIDYFQSIAEWMQLFAPDGSPVTNVKPMLAYLAGTRTFGYSIGFGSSTLAIATGWMVWSNCDTIGGGIDAKLLNFGPDVANSDVAANMPSRTLYLDYWARYFTELYSEESRIVECDAYLSPSDVASLQWADEILLREGRFRVLEINNYTATEGAPARLRLIRRLSDPYIECAFTINSISAGVVLFEDENGTVGFGNESCCTQYGYYWSGSKCLLNSPGSGRSTSFTPSSSVSTGGVSSIPSLLRRVNALASKVAHIFGGDSGITGIVPASGSEVISAEAIKEETDRKFLTSIQESSIANADTEITNINRILKTELEDKLGVFSDIADEFAPSLAVDNTAGTAVMRANTDSGVEVTGGPPGQIELNVQSWTGSAGSEAQVTGLRVQGSGSVNTKATVSILSGDFRITSTPTQFGVGSTVAFQDTATFNGSTSGISHDDLDDKPPLYHGIALDAPATSGFLVGSGSESFEVGDTFTFLYDNYAGLYQCVTATSIARDTSISGISSNWLAQANNFEQVAARGDLSLGSLQSSASSATLIDTLTSIQLTGTTAITLTSSAAIGLFAPQVFSTAAFQMASLTAASLSYPTSDGTNGQVLTTDGSGNLSFTTVSGGGGSSFPAVVCNIGGRWQWSLGDDQERVLTGSTAYGPHNWYSFANEPNDATVRGYTGSEVVGTTNGSMPAYYLHAFGVLVPGNHKLKVDYMFRVQNAPLSSGWGMSLWGADSPADGTTGNITYTLVSVSGTETTTTTNSVAVYSGSFTTGSAVTNDWVLPMMEHRVGTLTTTTYVYGQFQITMVS